MSFMPGDLVMTKDWSIVGGNALSSKLTIPEYSVGICVGVDHEFALVLFQYHLALCWIAYTHMSLVDRWHNPTHQVV